MVTLQGYAVSKDGKIDLDNFRETESECMRDFLIKMQDALKIANRPVNWASLKDMGYKYIKCTIKIGD